MPLLFVDDRQFTVDRAIETDVPSLIQILADDFIGSRREKTELKPYLAAFREITHDPQHYLAVVRDEQNQIVGTMQLTLLPGLSRAGAKRLLIEAVRLAPSVRGSGLGTALFRWAHTYGKEHGATIAQLTADNRRLEAHRFYESLGYINSHHGYKMPLT